MLSMSLVRAGWQDDRRRLNFRLPDRSFGSMLPAMRATRTDPNLALREE